MKFFLSAAAVILLFSGDYMRLGDIYFKIIALASMAAFFLGFWNRISVWSKGSGDFKSNNMLKEAVTGFFSKECFFAYRLFQKSSIRGIILALTIWSFTVLTIGSLSLSIEYLLRRDLTSSGLFSFVMDCAGLILLSCLCFYLLRRAVVKNARSITVMEDEVLLSLLFFIVVSGLALKGLRIAYAGGPSINDSPISSGLAEIFLLRCNTPVVLLKVRDVIWKLHALLAFLFFAYIPFSKQFHMFVAQLVTRQAEERNKQLWRILHE